MSNTTIQVSHLTKDELKELKFDLRLESYEEVLKILIKSYNVKTGENMSIRSVTWESVKGGLNAELIKKVEEMTNTEGRYIANIERDVRDQDPELANTLMEDLKSFQYEEQQFLKKKREEEYLNRY